MIKKIIFVFVIMLVLPPFASAQTDTSDSLTITTYYPSPYGVYGTLKLQPKPRAVTCREGEMTYSDGSIAQRGLYYCNDTQQWATMGAGGAGYWAENATSQTIYNTNSGNVGINIDQAVARLQVNGSAILGAAEGVANYESESCRIWSDPSYWGPAAAFQDALFIEKTDDDTAVEGGMIFGFATSTAGDTHIDSPGWAINHMPVMTLRGTGNVGIGTTNPLARLAVLGNATYCSGNCVHDQAVIGKGDNLVQGPRLIFGYMSSGGQLRGHHIEACGENSFSSPNPNLMLNLHVGSAATVNQGIIIRDETPGSGNRVGIGTTTPAYKLDVAGVVQATSFIPPSDIRWKRNIHPLSEVLEKVNRLQIVTFEWDTSRYPDKGFVPGRQVGLIGQDVEKVFPEVVVTDPQGYKSINYSELTAILIKAVKEQQSQIESLRKEIQAMKAAK